MQEVEKSKRGVSDNRKAEGRKVQRVLATCSETGLQEGKRFRVWHFLPVIFCRSVFRMIGTGWVMAQVPRHSGVLRPGTEL